MYNPNYMFNSSVRQTKIVEVNGINGATAYAIAPNSSVILLDTTAPIVYIKTTDGNGYANVAAYDLVPHKEQTTNNLEERIKRLEDLLNESLATTKQSNTEQHNAKVSANTANAND